jgi:hypothetical protein
LVALRGEKGLLNLVGEALDLYSRIHEQRTIAIELALGLKGSMSTPEAVSLQNQKNRGKLAMIAADTDALIDYQNRGATGEVAALLSRCARPTVISRFELLLASRPKATCARSRTARDLGL